MLTSYALYHDLYKKPKVRRGMKLGFLLVGSLFIVGISFLPDTAFALSENQTDCPIVRANLVSNNGRIDVDDFSQIEIHESVYPSDAIELSLKHLQSFCCKEQIFKDDPNNSEEIKLCENTTDEGPRSPYLIDHLVDVLARMHDGEGAYGDPSLVTPLGKERRETIEEYAVNKNGLPPQMIYNDFVAHRGQAHEGMNYKMVGYNEDLGDCDQFAHPIDLGNLRNYYHATCDIVYCLYHDMQSANYGGRIANYANDTLRTQAGYQQCHQMMQRRVQEETSYVKLTMLQQANNFTHTLAREYMQTYFLENRFSRLLKKLVDQQTWLEIITRKIGDEQVSAVCSITNTLLLLF